MGRAIVLLLFTVFVFKFVIAESTSKERWWNLDSGLEWTANDKEKKTVTARTSSRALNLQWKGKRGVWGVDVLDLSEKVLFSVDYSRNDNVFHGIGASMWKDEFIWRKYPTFTCLGPIDCRISGEPAFTFQSYLGNWSLIVRSDEEWGFKIEHVLVGSHTVTGKGLNGPGDGTWTPDTGLKRSSEVRKSDDPWRLECDGKWSVENPLKGPVNVGVASWLITGKRINNWVWKGDKGQWEVTIRPFSGINKTIFRIEYTEEGGKLTYLSGLCYMNGICERTFISNNCSGIEETSWTLHAYLGSVTVKSETSSDSSDKTALKMFIALPDGGGDEKSIGESYKNKKNQEIICKKYN